MTGAVGTRHGNGRVGIDRLRRLLACVATVTLLSGIGTEAATAADPASAAVSAAADPGPEQVNPQTEWPWVVRIKVKETHGDAVHYSFGSGVLVNDRTVLTAAHGFAGTVQVYVYAGRDSYGIVDLTRPSAGVDRIDSQGANGDLVALHLTRPIRLDGYAPVNPGYLPEPQQFPGPEAQPVSPHDLQGAGAGMGLGGIPLYEGAVINRFHQYSAQTFAQAEHPVYQSGRLVYAHIDPNTGAVMEGDSGGPVMIDGRVVGVLSGGNPEDTGLWNPPSYFGFTPFGDSPEFMNEVMSPSVGSVTTAPNTTQPAPEEPDELSTSWHSCACDSCDRAEHGSVPDGPVLDRAEQGGNGTAYGEADSCSVTGFRVFSQPVKDATGGTWAGAIQVDVTDPAARETQLTLPAGTGTQLWRTTVVPLIDGKPTQVDTQTGLPPSSYSGDLVGSTTGQYSMPTGLTVVPTGTEGMVQASWNATVTAPGAPKLAGYHLFVRATSGQQGEWGAWTSPTTGGITDHTTTTFNVSEAGTTGPWQTLVLPYYEQAEQTILIGADPAGKPFDTDAADRGVLVNTPQPSGQFPQPDTGAVYVTTGTIGDSSITALFDGLTQPAAANAEQDGSGSVRWERSASKDGSYSADGDWSALPGQNTTTLRFGTDGHPTNPNDAGWYRLKATTSLGTSYSTPVEVKISDWEPPRVLGQNPIPYGTTVGSTTRIGDAHISVLFTTTPGTSTSTGTGAPAAEPRVVWLKRNPTTDNWEPADLTRTDTRITDNGTPEHHQRIATLTFGRQAKGGSVLPSEADSGTYIAHITTTYPDGSEHVTHSLPVHVTIGTPPD